MDDEAFEPFADAAELEDLPHRSDVDELGELSRDTGVGHLRHVVNTFHPGGELAILGAAEAEIDRRGVAFVDHDALALRRIELLQSELRLLGELFVDDREHQRLRARGQELLDHLPEEEDREPGDEHIFVVTRRHLTSSSRVRP